MAVSSPPNRPNASTRVPVLGPVSLPSSLSKAECHKEGRNAAQVNVASAVGTPHRLSTKYVPLRPKPAPGPQSSLPEEGRQPAKDFSSHTADLKHIRPRTRCGIKCCPTPHCRLRTHRQYSLSLRSTSTSKVRAKNDDQQCTKSKPAFEKVLPCAPRLSILHDGVDGLPTLPLDGLEGPVFRELFHVFFSYQYDRIRRIMLPPPVSDAQKHLVMQNKHQILSLALSSPIYCLNYIAATHHHVTFQGRSGRTDPTTALIYGKVTALLRAKLSSYERSETPHILKVILTLVMFEISHGRIQSLALHRKAVKKIIDSHGGLHNMGDSIAMIQVMDRIFCIMLCSPSLHVQAPDQLVRKLTAISPSYGSYLETPPSKTVCGQQVHEFCSDICRAIEIIEDGDWSFDPRDTALPESPNSHYFFFLRECCAYRFVQLNASMAHDWSIPRCILLAAKIVEYKVCYDGYFIAFPVEIANRALGIIYQAGTEINWVDHADILNWILFVLLSCVSDSWEGRSWAVDRLKEQLVHKYAGDPWPDSWRQAELDNVRRFVWSDTRLSSTFMSTCSELSLRANMEVHPQVTIHGDGTSNCAIESFTDEGVEIE